MDVVLRLLKSIDFWTIVGSLGSVIAAIIAIFALSRFNKKSKPQERRDEIKTLCKTVEDLTHELISTYNIEVSRWKKYALAQSSEWRSNELEFKQHMSGTYELEQQIAIALGSLTRQPELETKKYSHLKDAAHKLAFEVDKKMSFRETTDQPILDSLKMLAKSRLDL